MVSKAKQLRLFLGLVQIVSAIFLSLLLFTLYHKYAGMTYEITTKNVQEKKSRTTTALRMETHKFATPASTKKEHETRKRLIQSHIFGEILIICLGIFFLLLIVAGLVLDILCIWPTVRVEEKLELREMTTVDATVESGIDNLATSENNNIPNNGGRSRPWFDMFSCCA